jgi:hypothetical protein
VTGGWGFIALGLPVTTKWGVLFLLKCLKNYKLNGKKLFRYKKTYPNRIFSLTDTIQEIFLFFTFRFCRDWEFGVKKTHAWEFKTYEYLATAEATVEQQNTKKLQTFLAYTPHLSFCRCRQG